MLQPILTVTTFT